MWRKQSLDEFILNHPARARIDFTRFESVKNTVSNHTKPNQPFNGVITAQQYDEIVMLIDNSNSIEASDLACRFNTKWNCPQGGTIAITDLESGLNRYFDFTLEVDAFSVFKTVSEAFHGIKIDSTRPTLTQAVAAYISSSRPTSGSSDSYYKRNTKVNIAKAVEDVLKHPYSNKPIIAAARNKDGKIRNIFNSPLSNYIREYILLSPLFSASKDYMSDSVYAYHPHKLSELIIRTAAKCMYAGDYKGMDYHISSALVYPVILAITGSTATAAAVADLLFNNIVYTGSSVYEGQSTLLSGVYPTHDIENIINYAIQYQIAVNLGFTIVPFGKRLAPSQASILVNGDDSVLFLGNVVDKSILAHHHAKIAASFGLEVEVDKVDYGLQSIYFCKQYWFSRTAPGHVARFGNSVCTETRILLPLYSIEKAIHAIRYPENIPNFKHNFTLLFWVAMIMDNAQGHPSWKRVMHYLSQIPRVRELAQLFNYQSAAEDLKESSSYDYYAQHHLDYSKYASPSLAYLIKK